MPDILIGLAIGFLIAAVLVLAWSGVGFFVAFAHYLIRKPAPAPPTIGAPPDCGICDALQGLWDDMQWWEKTASLLNFVAASIICTVKGCTSLDLRF
jgi:hypothetical protein